MFAPSFLRETLARIGSSMFAGTLVSCLVLGRLEPVHLLLMACGLALIVTARPLPGDGR